MEKLGFKTKSLVAIGDGFVKLLRFLVAVSSLVVDELVFRVEPNRIAEIRDRLFVVAFKLPALTQATIGFGILRVEANRLRKVGDSAVVVPLESMLATP